MNVRITAIRQANYTDLQHLYENPIDNHCSVHEGMTWLSLDGSRPEDFCPEAWNILQPYVEALARGEGHFYGNWMNNPYSALLSCNDGFRPVSFLVERVEEETPRT